jgi:hypothetical protein
MEVSSGAYRLADSARRGLLGQGHLDGNSLATRLRLLRWQMDIENILGVPAGTSANVPPLKKMAPSPR